MISDRLASVIIATVTVVWTVTILVSMSGFNDYEPPEAVHGAFLLIVGGALGLRAKGAPDASGKEGPTHRDDS